MIANCAQLKAMVADYLARSDLSAQMHGFIRLFEAKTNRRLAVAGQEIVTTITPDINGVVALPADFSSIREVVALTVPSRVLDSVTKSFADSQYSSATSGIPACYYVVGASLYPVPVTASGIKLVYYAGVSGLNADTDTNWLLTKNPDLYLYGTLAESCAFLMDDQAAARWQSAHDKSIAEIRQQDRSVRWSGGAMRIKEVTP